MWYNWIPCPLKDPVGEHRLEMKNPLGGVVSSPKTITSTNNANSADSRDAMP